ncbi:hypothetical protein ABTX81_23120 [Kitasatospora sp. NPDC097605]|uniref:hypothetical protein n=1 Tax=Kitasatospora sp. NPDC097605 TaxID=3157226 RepID=UPI00332371E8
MNRIKRFAAVAAATAVAALAPLTAAPAAQATTTANHLGMTWEVLNYGVGGTVQVGGPGGTASNAYDGDTPAWNALPVLCLNQDNRPAPAGLSLGFYNGWALGAVEISRPVKGTELTSPEAANTVCRTQFGRTWRQAEFHDGHYGDYYQWTGGWTFWASGNLPKGVRFWTYINDQNANPWNG